MLGQWRLITIFPLLIVLSEFPYSIGDYNGSKVERNGEMMAYDWKHHTEHLIDQAKKEILALAVGGAGLGAPFGLVGSIIGGIAGIFAGIAKAGGNAAFCAYKCDSGKSLACVHLVRAWEACCRDDFKKFCFTNWTEVENLFPLPTTTTTTTTPAPLIPIIIDKWIETYDPSSPKNMQPSNTMFACKRGSKRQEYYFLTGDGRCQVKSNQCFFVFCDETPGKKNSFAEWGCIPKNGTNSGWKFCVNKVEMRKDGKECNCAFERVDVSKDNEQRTFEEFYYHYHPKEFRTFASFGFTNLIDSGRDSFDSFTEADKNWGGRRPPY